MSDTYHNADVDQALARFRVTIQAKEEEAARAHKAEQEVIEAKSAELLELRMLLRSFEQMGVIVSNSQANARKNLSAVPQPLKVYERPTSETWAPGRSLCLDHPAVMEIAIPNPKDIATKGIVVIHLASEHNDATLFERPFKTKAHAIQALGEFITRNTVSVQRMIMDSPDEDQEPATPDPVAPPG